MNKNLGAAISSTVAVIVLIVVVVIAIRPFSRTAEIASNLLGIVVLLIIAWTISLIVWLMVRDRFGGRN
jgi:hypothetical protein